MNELWNTNFVDFTNVISHISCWKFQPPTFICVYNGSMPTGEVWRGNYGFLSQYLRPLFDQRNHLRLQDLWLSGRKVPGCLRGGTLQQTLEAAFVFLSSYPLRNHYNNIVKLPTFFNSIHCHSLLVFNFFAITSDGKSHFYNFKFFSCATVCFLL